MHQATAQELVERVDRIATRMKRKYYLPQGMEDLAGEGLLGLAEARLRHDPGRGTELWTFAYGRIQGRMFEMVRREARHGQLAKRTLRYDEQDWEGESEVHRGVVNPAAVRTGADGRCEGLSMESCVARRHIALLTARLLADLPQEHRHVVVEVLMNNATLAQVSRELGKPVWMVRTTLQQAIRRMRKELQLQGYTVAELFGK